MLWIMLSLLLFVLAIYGFKVRNEKAWGTPLLVVSLLALIVSVILPRVIGPPSVSTERVQGVLEAQTEGARLLGQALSPHVQGGASVLLLVPWPAGGAPGSAASMERWSAALGEGLGMDWTPAGTMGPLSMLTAGGVLDEAGVVDAIVSFGGLPEYPEEFAGDVPVVAWFQKVDDAQRQQISQLLQDGILVGAAIIEVEGETATVLLHTSDNLP